jgi:hypothetical protein
MSPKTPQKNQKQMIPSKIAMMAPATTSLIKCTPPTTLMTARPIPKIIINIPIGMLTWKYVQAIMKIENTCLLGKLLPTVSFSKAGVKP